MNAFSKYASNFLENFNETNNTHIDKQSQDSNTIYKKYPIPVDNIQSMHQLENQWILFPFTDLYEINTKCSLYVRSFIYTLATSTNLKYILIDILKIMYIYANKYNSDICGYLTGYTDNNNLQVKANSIGCKQFNVVIYIENGLINSVASYSK